MQKRSTRAENATKIVDFATSCLHLCTWLGNTAMGRDRSILQLADNTITHRQTAKVSCSVCISATATDSDLLIDITNPQSVLAAPLALLLFHAQRV